MPAAGQSLHDFSNFTFLFSPLRVLTEHWIICAALLAATCLVLSCYKASPRNHSCDTPTLSPTSSPLPLKTTSAPQALLRLSLVNALSRLRRRRPLEEPSPDIISPNSSPLAKKPGYTRRSRFSKKPIDYHQSLPPPMEKQYYDAFLVLDVEATCQLGTDFDFPNEIIEFPVCLMRWTDRTKDLKASQLEVVAEFRSFVKPTWKPVLSEFCTNLTGITQEQVDAAPLFPVVLDSFQNFMVQQGLIDGDTGRRLVRFCWCSDGPFDIRDFVVKQCFISAISMPSWIQGDVLDVRAAVREQTKGSDGPRPFNIPAQLKVLGLPGFEGREHSGIDDTRNIARIVAELARTGISLYPKTVIDPNRRWPWMGKHPGQIVGQWTMKSTNDKKPWQKL